MMRIFATILIMATVGAWGQQDTCISCEKPIQTELYMCASPYHKERKPACPQCVKDPVYCFTCGLPARKNLDLKDGRVLCKRDAKTAVLSGEDAKLLFEEVKRDMLLTLRGSKAFPLHNITFTLVDRHELENLSRVRRFPSTHSSLMGITRSYQKDGKWQHEISVLAGMPPNKFLGVCAHEYGHAWLHENLTELRVLDSDTVEGFCELLAYKYIVAKGDAIEKTLLLDNDYTNGQIDVFVKAESEYNFYHVTKWVINGEDASLSATNIARLLALKSDPDAAAAAFAWPPPSAAQVSAPTNLVLKNISGTARRRFAMINGTTLAPNELAKIPLAGGTVTVRCLEIKDTSVIIQVSGESKPQELFLAAKTDAVAR